VNGHAPKIMLSSGKVLDLFNPDPDMFDIKVIAQALSRLCRFTGHTKRFYSVAEHSVLVSRLLRGHSNHVQLAGLLHDASEAFYGDLHSPLKHSSVMTEYRLREKRMEMQIMKHFAVNPGIREQGLIKEADDVACATEVRYLMPKGEYWKDLPKPVRATWTLGVEPRLAEEMFLRRYDALRGR